MNDKYTMVLQILKDAGEEISSVLVDKDDELHKLRIVSALTRLHDQTAQMTGHGISVASDRPGRPQSRMIKGAEQKALLARKNYQGPEINMAAKVDAFRSRVEEAYARFPKMAVKEILGSFEELVVRGVARKAKMQGVSDVSPEKVDASFVEQIKKAVMENDERNLKSEAEAKNAKQRELEEQIKEDKAKKEKADAEKLKSGGKGSTQPPAIPAETEALTDAKPKTPNSGQFKKK